MINMINTAPLGTLEFRSKGENGNFKTTTICTGLVDQAFAPLENAILSGEREDVVRESQQVIDRVKADIPGGTLEEVFYSTQNIPRLVEKYGCLWQSSFSDRHIEVQATHRAVDLESLSEEDRYGEYF